MMGEVEQMSSSLLFLLCIYSFASPGQAFVLFDAIGNFFKQTGKAIYCDIGPGHPGWAQSCVTQKYNFDKTGKPTRGCCMEYTKNPYCRDRPAFVKQIQKCAKLYPN